MPDFLDEADKVGVMLRARLQAALELLPESARRSMALSRYLQVNRGISQRIISGAKPEHSPREVLTKSPGVDGLRSFASALERRVGASQHTAELWAVIEEFECVIARGGGSQSALTRLLATKSGSGGDVSDQAVAAGWDSLETRRAMFDSTLAVCGKCHDVTHLQAALRPGTSDPNSVESASLLACLGIEGRPLSLPSVFRELPADRTEDDDGGFPAHLSAMVTELCSKPTPEITPRSFPDGSVYYLSAQPPGAPPIDVVLADTENDIEWDPRGSVPLPISSTMEIATPTRLLVVEQMIHRDLLRNFEVGTLHLLGMSYSRSSTARRWASAVPSNLQLQSIGPGTASRESAPFAKYHELTEYMMSEKGWDRSEFTTFRLAVEYPIWSSTYAIESTVSNL